MERAIIQLEPLTCPSCMQKIEHTVRTLNGVDENSVKVLFNTSKFKTKFDGSLVSLKEIEQAIEALGYPILEAKIL